MGLLAFAVRDDDLQALDTPHPLLLVWHAARAPRAASPRWARTHVWRACVCVLTTTAWAVRCQLLPVLLVAGTAFALAGSGNAQVGC
jgi:hypothetical protein